MRKIIIIAFALSLLLVVACQKQAEKASQWQEATEPANELGSADELSNDLSDSEMSEIDSGLADIENI